MKFAAIDFELANQKRYSACYLAVVVVEDNEIKSRHNFFIKPPDPVFTFSNHHGIDFDVVKEAPAFNELWKELLTLLSDTDFLVAHNASTDKSILKNCCEYYDIKYPEFDIRCTMQLARKELNIYPSGLDTVKDRLNIMVPESGTGKAEASARIMMYYQRNGRAERNRSLFSLFEHNESPAVCVLGSSSAGNSTLIGDKKGSILIDVGFSRKYLLAKLEELGKDLRDIKAIFITHLHNDHLNSTTLKIFLELGTRVYIPEVMKEAFFKIHAYYKNKNFDNLIFFGDEILSSGNINIAGFEVPHDSKGGCYGYNIFYNKRDESIKISHSTDIGHFNDELVEKFSNSDVIIIESNHDIDMLMNSRRSAFLKSRIRKTGHLSNIESRDFIYEVLSKSAKHPKYIFLAHISQECNTNSIAFNTMNGMLTDNGLDKIETLLTFKDKISKVVKL